MPSTALRKLRRGTLAVTMTCCTVGSQAVAAVAVRCGLDEPTSAAPSVRFGQRSLAVPGGVVSDLATAAPTAAPLHRPGLRECLLRWASRDAAFDEGLTAEVDTVLSRRREALPLPTPTEQEQVQGHAVVQYSPASLTLGPLTLRSSLAAQLDLARGGDGFANQREFGLSATQAVSVLRPLPTGWGWLTAQLSERRLHADSNLSGRTRSQVRALGASWGRSSGVGGNTSLSLTFSEATIAGALRSTTRSLSASLARTLPVSRHASLRWSVQGGRGKSASAFRIGEVDFATLGTSQRLQARVDWQQRWLKSDIHLALVGQRQDRRYGTAAASIAIPDLGPSWTLVGRIEGRPTSTLRLSGSLSYAEHNAVSAQLKLAWAWP
jgi:hypothetical protein